MTDPTDPASALPGNEATEAEAEAALEGDLDGKGILTFTANRHAQGLVLLAAILLTLAIALFFASGFPFGWISRWWVLLPILPAGVALFFAWDAARHPYLLLDGEGIIEDPFTEDSQKTAWAHISETEQKGANLVLLTSNPLTPNEPNRREISLRPLHPAQRRLLFRAIESQQMFAAEELEEEEGTSG